MDNRLTIALDAAASGMRVFPQDRNKRPCIKEWPERATTDAGQIKGWSKQFPTANFATATGELSGIVILDVDTKNGQPGAQSLAALEERLGAFETLRVRTPSGGSHLYFHYPEGQDVRNSQLQGFPGIEVKGNGGAVTLPGSFYASGAEYVVQTDRILAELPDGILELLKNAAKNGDRPRSEQGAPDSIEEGGRNNYLAQQAGKLRRLGTDYEVILAALMAENTKCNPPLPEAEVREIAKSVSRYEPPDDLLTLRRTDSGNAERFVKLYGHKLKHCDEHGAWLIWDGQRWRRDATRLVMHLGRLMVLRLYQLGARIDDEAERAAFMQYVAGLDRLARVKNAIEWATSDPAVAVRSSSLDAYAALLNLANGTLELETMTFREHRQADLLTRTTAVTFDENAKCPRWEIFLDEVFNGDEDLKHFIQQAVGYSLTGSTREQCLFILHGTGANGKSTFVEIVAELLGDYAMRTPVESLMVKHGDASIPNDLARLKGARLVHSVETESGKRLAEAMVKSLTGGDTIVARFLHAEFFEFRPEFKIWLATNHRPVIRGQDLAIWRRMRLVPFNVTFPPERQDKELLRKLREELPGILNWALAGCKDWLANGLSMPAAVKAATDAYRTDMDSLREFLDEYVEGNSAAETPAKILYAAYKSYCEETSERAVSRNAFGMQLTERGYLSRHSRGGTVWENVQLRSREP